MVRSDRDALVRCKYEVGRMSVMLNVWDESFLCQVRPLLYGQHPVHGQARCSRTKSIDHRSSDRDIFLIRLLHWDTYGMNDTNEFIHIWMHLFPLVTLHTLSVLRFSSHRVVPLYFFTEKKEEYQE